MMKRRALLSLLPAVLACSAPALDPEAGGGPGGKADDAGEAAVLTFDADYGETLEGRIVAGGTVRVRYDLDRLASCRGEQYGRPAWMITGNYSVDGGAPRTFAVMEVQGAEAVALEPVLSVPYGGEIAFFFYVTNLWGCIEYDSDYGANYTYTIEGGGASGGPGDVAVLAFEADGAPRLTGRLVRGGSFVLHYDPARLPDCRGTSVGYPAWNIYGWMQVDGGVRSPIEVTAVAGLDRVAADPVVQVPAGRDLALAFEITSRWGCHAVDDAGGALYHFPID